MTPEEEAQISAFHSAIRRGYRKAVRGMLLADPKLALAADVWGQTSLFYAHCQKDAYILALIQEATNNNQIGKKERKKERKMAGLPTLTVEQSLDDFMCDPLQDPPEKVSGAEQGVLARGDVEFLASMFSSLPRETLELALTHSGHNLQVAIDFLLGDQPLGEGVAGEFRGEHKEVQLNSEEDFPSLTTAPKPAPFQPPKLGLLSSWNEIRVDQLAQAEVESVEWVGYEDDEDYDQVSDDGHRDSEGSSIVLVHGDNWDVVSGGSEMSFSEIGDEIREFEEEERSTTRPISFSAALKQNLNGTHVKVKAPRLPPSTFASDDARVPKGRNSDEEEGGSNDLYSSKDFTRVFGAQTKPRKNERARYKPPKKTPTKQTRGIC